MDAEKAALDERVRAVQASEERASCAAASAREDLERAARDCEADRVQLEKRMADFRHATGLPMLVIPLWMAAIC